MLLNFTKEFRHVCLSLQNVSKSHFEFYLFLQPTKSYLRLLRHCVHRQKHFLYIIFIPCFCTMYVGWTLCFIFLQWKKKKIGYIIINSVQDNIFHEEKNPLIFKTFTVHQTPEVIPYPIFLKFSNLKAELIIEFISIFASDFFSNFIYRHLIL